MHLCSTPRGLRGIKPETFIEKTSAFIIILPSDHCTCKCGLCCVDGTLCLDLHEELMLC